MKNLFLFLFGRFTSTVGNSIFNLAIPLLILDKTSSGRAMGSFMGTTFLPALLILPFVGLYIEKRNKKKIMIITDILQFTLFFALWYHYHSYGFSIGFLTLFISISKVIGRFFDISSVSIFPRIIDESLYGKGNSWQGILDNISELTSPILGVFLYKTQGIESIFLLNALTFLISAVSEIFLKYKNLESTQNTVNRFSFSEYKDIFNLVKTQRFLKNSYLLLMIINFLMAPLAMTVIPFALLKVINISEWQYGVINFAEIFGLLIGSAIMLKVSHSQKNIKLYYQGEIICIFIQGFIALFLGVIGKTYYFYIFLTLNFLAGSFNSLSLIPLSTQLKSKVNPTLQGRFFASLSFFGGILVPFGNYLLGLLTVYVNTAILIIMVSSITLFLIGTLNFSEKLNKKIP